MRGDQNSGIASITSAEIQPLELSGPKASKLNSIVGHFETIPDLLDTNLANTRELPDLNESSENRIKRKVPSQIEQLNQLPI